jgi:putative SOS response-associated peptidase YedK
MANVGLTRVSSAGDAQRTVGTNPGHTKLFDGIRDRMPVMLMPEDYDRWLDSALSIDDARSLLRPYDENLMKAYEVSRAVNSVKNDTPECVEPLS